VLDLRARRVARALNRRHPAPATTFVEPYGSVHRALVAELLDDPAVLRGFAGGARFPVDLGPGFDERVVEYPWLLSRKPAGRVLDAGSVLNHAHILDRVLPRVAQLTITTLVPEPQSFPERGVDYVYADLRELPFADAAFDTVVCLSTLEHVGMDNEVYGAAEPRSENPEVEVARAAAELRRVTRPGGRVLLSVPFGRAEDHGWFRQLDAAGLDELLEAFGASSRDIAIYAYRSGGWRRADAALAADARYRTRNWAANPAEDAAAPDRAAAARAVACVALTLPER
jgi:SAM-dependent methyltransferase